MPSQTAASMNAIISINGKVVQSVSSGFTPQLLVLTQNPILPTETLKQFINAEEVLTYFGESSYNNNAEYSDYKNASFYFKGSNKTTIPPSSILFYRYVESNTGAFTRGNKLSAIGTTNDLTTLKLVTAGTLNLVFNGTTYAITGIDLSGATSFVAMASLIETKIQLVSDLATATVEFDTITNAFTITLPYDALTANTVGFVTNSATGATDQLAQRMKITETTGAVLSQGLPAQTPAQVMDAVTNLSTNFVPFICNFDTNSDVDYSIDIGLTAWTLAYPILFLYMAYDTKGGATSPITNPKQTALINAGYGQNSVAPYTFNTNIMYFIVNDSTITLPFATAGSLASIQFNAINGMLQLDASSYSGITPVITNNNDLSLLLNTFGANSYINLNTRNNNFQWFEKGNIGGSYAWADTFVGYIWLADQIQVTIAGLKQSLNSIPYNNLSILNAVIDPIFKQALTNGVAQNNIPLDATEKQQLILQAGYDFTSILYNEGYYLPQIVPTAQDITNRTLSNIKAWYTYAGGPVTISVSVTTVI